MTPEQASSALAAMLYASEADDSPVPLPVRYRLEGALAALRAITDGDELDARDLAMSFIAMSFIDQ